MPGRTMEVKEKIKKEIIWGKIWLTFYSFFMIFMLAFTLIFCLMKPLWYDINEYIIDLTNANISWVALLLILTFLELSYTIYLFVFHLIEQLKKGKTKPHLANKIIPFPLLATRITMLIVLILEAGSELSIVRVQLEFISPLIFLFILIGAFFVSLLGASQVDKHWKKYQRNKEKIKHFWNDKNKAIIYGVFSILLFTSAAFLPFLFQPANVYRTELPAKPKLVAHRGASHLAPENTLVAGEFAVKWGAIGWEVDVTISYDGVLFMMHDSTLLRTTNVEEIFENRKDDHASSFNISELKQLDAGSWFFEQDPFRTIHSGYVTQSEANSYIGEKIPTLEEVINLTRENNLLLDIDYKYPPSDHPYYESYMTLLLAQLNSSNLGKNILISSFDPLAENMTHVCGARSVEELNASGCELINTHHGLTNKEFRIYENNDFDVMVWTVDSKSRFSQLWCLGVDYIKTNNLHLFANMTNPSWSLTTETYMYIWVGILIGIGLIGVPIYFLASTGKKQKRKQEESDIEL